MNRFLYLSLLLLLPWLGHGQILLFQGKVVDERTNAPLQGVEVRTELDATTTDAQGEFELELAMDVRQVTFEFFLEGYETTLLEVEVTDLDVKDLGTISLATMSATTQLGAEELIPTVVLDDNDLDDDAVSQDISGLLTASRDVFVSAAAFTFGPARFRIRGYDSENTTVLMNGVPVNDLENGRVFWGAWGGLNDVTRLRQTDFGLGPIEYAFGGIGGATFIDTRASVQRKQLRASYSSSNRTYRNRLMLTYSTGQLENGWAFSLSGSHRWAQEGYIEGTFYDAWSYFASIDKKLNEQHQLNLTAFGAPTKRGRSTASVAELYELNDDPYYNPFWGYQAGEKRNSRVGNTHQPVFILRHDWSFGGDATLTTAASFQFGRNGSTALNWYNAPDPRPTYYRYLPSWLDVVESPLADYVAQRLMEDDDLDQIDWDFMYYANQVSNETVENADGIDGNTVTGRFSRYVVEDRRFDSKEFNLNTNYQNVINEHLTVQAGLGYQYYRGDYFKELVDLLGGEFFVDIDPFAERDFPGDEEIIQNNLAIPNRILHEGDRYGYDYNPNIRKTYGWLQGNFNYRSVDFFLAGELSGTNFWRTGDVANGRFPDNSFGNSEKQSFFNYGLKAGVTYKFDNRNYLYFNGAYLTRAPYFRNSYLSPRVRNDAVDGLTDEKILSGEFGYTYRSPVLKARATAYYARFEDGVRSLSFFTGEEVIDPIEADTLNLSFVNYALSGIDKEHIGIEIALDYKVNSALSLNAVAAIGQYIFDSRPTADIVNDNNPNDFLNDRTIYLKNFYIAGTPQSAYTFGINYSGKKFWFANLNVSYFDNVYIDVNPNRRTEPAVDEVFPGGEQWESILLQEKADPALTVDFFGGKSFRFGDTFLYLNVGVSNILDNKKFITGGFEQLRYDFEARDPSIFRSRYFYLFGRTYFLNLSVRL